MNHLRRKVAEVESRKPEQRQFNLTAAQLKRISDQYPELADALANDLTDVFGATVEAKQQEQQPQAPQDDPRLNTIQESTEKLAEQVKQIALTELSRVHEDWRTVARWWVEDVPGVGKVIQWANPKFAEWVNHQDDGVREAVFNGEDVSAIAQVITKFKNETKPAQQQETTTQNKSNVNRKLEKAVLPTGRRTGSHELLSDDEIIQQAQREEQKRIMNGY